MSRVGAVSLLWRSSVQLGRTPAALSLNRSAHTEVENDALKHYPFVIERHGKREVLGHGHNGQKNYIDRIEFPMPAVRFREETPQIAVLRQKEKGDWKKLTHAEIKDLYRHTFCMTFAEINAPTGDWKLILSFTCIGVSLGIMLYLLVAKFVYKPYPESMTNPERVESQIQRKIDLALDPVAGLSSKWDYEKGQWK